MTFVFLADKEDTGVTLIGDFTRRTRQGGHRDHLGDLTEAPLQCMSPKLKVLNKFPGRHSTELEGAHPEVLWVAESTSGTLKIF